MYFYDTLYYMGDVTYIDFFVYMEKCSILFYNCICINNICIIINIRLIIKYNQRYPRVWRVWHDNQHVFK